jgi:hypothetical protein
MTTAYAKSRLIAEGFDVVPGPDPITVVSPSSEVVEAFSVERPISLYDEEEFKVRTFIPSDNLFFRSSEDVDVDIGGETIELNIQDANLLKIRTFWCYRMKTPLLSALIHEVVSGSLLSPASEEQIACNLASLLDDGYYLAISSQSVIRMQTHFLKEES